jgi:hypothetical protein
LGVVDDFIVFLFLIKEVLQLVMSKRETAGADKFPFEKPNVIEGEIID